MESSASFGEVHDVEAWLALGGEVQLGVEVIELLVVVLRVHYLPEWFE